MADSTRQPRTVIRRHFPEPVRIELLEVDADVFEAALDDKIDAIRRAQRFQTGVGISILLALIGALAGIAFK